MSKQYNDNFNLFKNFKKTISVPSWPLTLKLQLQTYGRALYKCEKVLEMQIFFYCFYVFGFINKVLVYLYNCKSKVIRLFIVKLWFSANTDIQTNI